MLFDMHSHFSIDFYSLLTGCLFAVLHRIGHLFDMYSHFPIDFLLIFESYRVSHLKCNIEYTRVYALPDVVVFELVVFISVGNISHSHYFPKAISLSFTGYKIYIIYRSHPEVFARDQK